MAVDCCLNQPETWLILAIDSIRGGYLFPTLLVEFYGTWYQSGSFSLMMKE
jgi:hypothetical protein